MAIKGAWGWRVKCPTCGVARKARCRTIRARNNPDGTFSRAGTVKNRMHEARRKKGRDLQRQRRLCLSRPW